jgi:cobalt-precorrin-6B (C15)-methyltransferase
MKDKYFVPGIPDHEFDREPGIPMTKNEIRVLSLARLSPYPGAVVFDIGAGTGSIAIESKLLVPDSRVYAVERDPRALRLIERNCAKFEVELNIVAGAAPAVLESLPMADRIFIGGSGGQLEEILRSCDRKLRPGGRLVLNSVSLFTGPRAYQLMEDLGYRVEALQINVAVSSGKDRAFLWEARNPVTIVWGQKGEVHDLG